MSMVGLAPLLSSTGSRERDVGGWEQHPLTFCSIKSTLRACVLCNNTIQPYCTVLYWGLGALFPLILLLLLAGTRCLSCAHQCNGAARQTLAAETRLKPATLC
jgi:hypothetical protein